MPCVHILPTIPLLSEKQLRERIIFVIHLNIEKKPNIGVFSPPTSKQLDELETLAMSNTEQVDIDTVQIDDDKSHISVCP